MGTWDLVGEVELVLVAVARIGPHTAPEEKVRVPLAGYIYIYQLHQHHRIAPTPSLLAFKDPIKHPAKNARHKLIQVDQFDRLRTGRPFGWGEGIRFLCPTNMRRVLYNTFPST